MTSHVLQAVVALPTLAAALAFILGRRNGAAFALANTGIFLAGLGALGLLVQHLGSGQHQVVTTVGALPLGRTLQVPLELRTGGSATVVGAVVLFVAFCVQMFARWYLYSDPRYRSFASTVSLFTSAMLLVVFSNDALLTLAGWEVMGWCSYLLIGHESNQRGPRRAAHKAFLVTRFADAPFVLGFAVLAMGADSTRLTDIITAWEHLPHAPRLFAVLCLICGVLGKSAQFPFMDWLPDAMEGPTPASALIHAATMVAAGTVVLAQLNGLLALEPSARLVLVIVAGGTSIFAAFSAFCQPDIKRLLAWSTISQVGLMLLGLGVVPDDGNPRASLTHLIGHAFFKSLVFLVVGWLSVIVGSTLATRMTGAVRRLPRAFMPMALGLYAMSGLPPTMAFVSKDSMLDSAGRSQADGRFAGTLGFVLLLVIIAGTAAYTMRAWLILQYRTTLERRGERQVIHDSHVVKEIDIVEMLATSPEVDEFGEELAPAIVDEEDEVLPKPGLIVRFCLVLLGLFAVFGGLIALTGLFGVETVHVNLPLMGASVLLILATVVVVRLMSLRQLYGDAARRLPRWIPLAAARGFGLERVYTAVVATPVLALARGVAKADGALDSGVGSSATALRRAGEVLNTVHTRKPSTGLLWVVLGVVLASLLGVTLAW